jgi:hypothetical protein
MHGIFTYKRKLSEGLFFLCQLSNFSATCISWREQVNFKWDDDEVCFVVDQHGYLDFIMLAHWNNSTQIDIVALLWHIILIPSQPVFALSPQCCVLSGEATNTNFIVFGLTHSGLEPHDLLHSRRGNHNTTHAVYKNWNVCM